MNASMDIQNPKILEILACLSRYLYGKDLALKLALITCCSRGHLLIEDLPGLGKTVLALSIARVLGLTVALVAGIVLGRLRMERYLEDWVLAVANGQSAATYDGDGMGWAQRLEAGGHHVREIVGKVWPYVVAGIALGAGIHGYVPQDFMAAIMGRDAWWSVPVAVLLGVPMYTNAAGVIPIVQALLGKGAALGTVLAFIMLSLIHI